MPKLYYTPTSCGAASFIVAYTENVENLDVEVVDLGSHKTSSGEDFMSVNKKGNVPTIRLDDGSILNENVAVLSWLSQQGDQQLGHPAGTAGFYRMLNCLAFIASELHSSLGVLFYPTPSDEVKSFLKERAEGKLKKLDELFLRDTEYLAGDKLTVADVYCYIVLTWLPHLGLGPLEKYPAAAAFFERIKAMPKVQEAHKRMDTNPAKVLG